MRTSLATRRTPDHQVTQGEHRRAARTNTPPARVVLAERVRAAVEAAAGMGREGFERALGASGVEFVANVASTGRVSGYRFALPGHQDGAGERVWFKASRLDKELSWGRVQGLLEAPERLPQVQVDPKGRFERQGAYDERVSVAQQAALAGSRQAKPLLDASRPPSATWPSGGPSAPRSTPPRPKQTVHAPRGAKPCASPVRRSPPRPGALPARRRGKRPSLTQPTFTDTRSRGTAEAMNAEGRPERFRCSFYEASGQRATEERSVQVE